MGMVMMLAVVVMNMSMFMARVFRPLLLFPSLEDKKLLEAFQFLVESPLHYPDP
jgi:hypothetical protein